MENCAKSLHEENLEKPWEKRATLWLWEKIRKHLPVPQSFDVYALLGKESQESSNGVQCTRMCYKIDLATIGYALNVFIWCKQPKSIL